MKDLLFNALAGCTADYAEIRCETRDSTVLSYRGAEIEDVGSGRFEGGIVRACIKGGWGISVFDSPHNLRDHVREACANAALVGHGSTELADNSSGGEMTRKARMTRDFRGVPFAEKLQLLNTYNDIILKAHPSVESSHVTYSESFRTVHFASSRGLYFRDERPRIILNLVAVARDGSLVQRASESVSSAHDYGVVIDRESVAREVADRADALLRAPQCDGGKHTVVLRPDFAGVFAHEAFGHLSEADFLYENPKMKSLMTLGRKMGTPDLSIVDDGSLDQLIGTQAVDDEGSLPQKTNLITKGELTGHLHSLETAAKMGAAPTGNARAVSRGCAPIVRMTNTYIDAGPLSRDALFQGVDNGIYACGMMGGQTMMEMFTFSAAYGYRIHNGQIGELLRDIVITGNVFETLHAIDGIADDLQMFELGGGCGKGGQANLPVSFGGPHVRVRDVVIGGK